MYDKLRRFRAGIDVGISLLKRVFGLARCVWKGAIGFHAYARTAVLRGQSPPARARSSQLTTTTYPQPRATHGSRVARPLVSVRRSHGATRMGDGEHHSSLFATPPHPNYFRGQKSSPLITNTLFQDRVELTKSYRDREERQESPVCETGST